PGSRDGGRGGSAGHLRDPSLGEGLARQGAEVVAVDTGGFTIRNTSDLTKGLRLIADTASAYYLIGYDPAKATRSGEFRKIQVRLDHRNKGLEVIARGESVAPEPAAALADLQQKRYTPLLIVTRSASPPSRDRVLD